MFAFISNLCGWIALAWFPLIFAGAPATPFLWLLIVWAAGRGKAFWAGVLIGLFPLE